jgi:hypothetical protein
VSRRIVVLGGALSKALGLGLATTSSDLVIAEPSPPLFVDSRRTYAPTTNPKIKRVAGPNGFKWHVKRDGQTVSSHATQAEALAALGGLKR